MSADSPASSVQLRFAQGIDHPPHAPPEDRPGAHGARLGAGVKRAPGELLRRILVRRQAHQVRLGVPGAVVAGNDRIFRLEQYISLTVRQQRPERVVAVRPRLAGEINSGA